MFNDESRYEEVINAIILNLETLKFIIPNEAKRNVYTKACYLLFLHQKHNLNSDFNDKIIILKQILPTLKQLTVQRHERNECHGN